MRPHTSPSMNCMRSAASLACPMSPCGGPCPAPGTRPWPALQPSDLKALSPHPGHVQVRVDTVILEDIQTCMASVAAVFAALATLGVATTVQTAYGPVMGSETAPGIAAFLGVPFAAPPVGPLRFHPPTVPAPWAAPLNTTTQPVPCLQNSKWQPNAVSGEDCLYLNGELQGSGGGWGTGPSEWRVNWH